MSANASYPTYQPKNQKHPPTHLPTLYPPACPAHPTEPPKANASTLPRCLQVRCAGPLPAVPGADESDGSHGCGQAVGANCSDVTCPPGAADAEGFSYYTLGLHRELEYTGNCPRMVQKNTVLLNTSGSTAPPDFQDVTKESPADWFHCSGEGDPEWFKRTRFYPEMSMGSISGCIPRVACVRGGAGGVHNWDRRTHGHILEIRSVGQSPRE